MKNSKFKDRVIDILIELGVAFVCIVVGVLILKIFNVDVFAGDFNFELALIIGCIALVTVIVICYTLFWRYRGKK